MFNPDISVIIPVYNADNTLKRSIESVLQQKKLNLEIICIDDGSTDTSIELIRTMQEQYPQIILLKQEHCGAGPARNLGIKSSKGRYISFLDADDEYIDPEALGIMVHACLEHHASICGSYRVISENGKERDTGLLRDYLIPEKGCFIEYSEFQYDYDYQSFVFDRNFLIQNEIWFPPYMRYQDPPFFVKAMAIAGKFYVAPVVLYKYKFDSSKYNIVTRYIDHILSGIYDTLEIAKMKKYNKMFENVIGRVEWEYHDAILQNLSEKSMPLLVAIDAMSKEFQGKGLGILSAIYKGMGSIGKLVYSHDLLRDIVLIKQKEGFQTYFKRYGIYSVVIYGLGAYGEILINELEICGIKIICGIDKSVIVYGDIPVIRPEDEVPECDALIISVMEPEEIVEYYMMKENIKVYTFTAIIRELAKEIQEKGYQNETINTNC